MYHWLNPALSKKIDDLTWDHAVVGSRHPELKQLSALFDERFLSDLYKLMLESLVARSPSDCVLSIKIGWIDKIPLAEAKILGRRTELGDAVLFALEQKKSSSGPGAIKARAVLLQAKVTDSYSQLTSPTVPIAPISGSTIRELQLFSSWPRFTLFKTSRSKKPVLSSVDIAKGTAQNPYGWFMAAPRISRIKPYIKMVWPSWWMLGPSLKHHKCQTSFGDFLVSFLKGQRLTTSNGTFEIGESFQWPSYPPPSTGLPDWPSLCAEIVQIIESTAAPQSLFFGCHSRIASVPDLPLHFYAPHMSVFSPSHLFSWVDRVLFYRPDRVVLFQRKPRDPDRQRPRNRRRRGKKMPVIIFHTYSAEWEGLD